MRCMSVCQAGLFNGVPEECVVGGECLQHCRAVVLSCHSTLKGIASYVLSEYKEGEKKILHHSCSSACRWLYTLYL